MHLDVDHSVHSVYVHLDVEGPPSAGERLSAAQTTADAAFVEGDVW